MLCHKTGVQLTFWLKLTIKISLFHERNTHCDDVLNTEQILIEHFDEALLRMIFIFIDSDSVISYPQMFIGPLSRTKDGLVTRQLGRGRYES